MFDQCKIFQEKWSQDIFFSDDSPNVIGGWFPDVVKTHANFLKWYKKHSKHCDICVLNQPERSKREDLDCNCKDLEYLHKRYTTYVMEYDEKSDAIIEKLLKQSKMRCSEHCGNTVRGK